MGIPMSTPLPPPFEQLGQRKFSFYPAIVNIEHNEWRLRKVTWSEVLVVNTKTGQELWISRRFLGEISRTDEPVMIVGLTKELQFVAGQVIPYVRRVIELPRAVNAPAGPSFEEPAGSPAHVVGIRLESSEKRIGRLVAWVLAVSLVVCVVFITLFRSHSNPRVRYTPVIQSNLGLTGADQYETVVAKLGQPASDGWLSDQGEMQYRVLKYPERGISIVLMGVERNKAVYIGAVDDQWRIVDAISLPGNKDTRSMLRSLKH